MAVNASRLEALILAKTRRVQVLPGTALEVVRGQAGDHVRHHFYFLDFPANVPDTTEFWAQCLRETLLDPVTAGQVEAGLGIGPTAGPGSS